MNTDPREAVGEGRERDAYGGVWRVDRRPWRLEEPPLAGPTLDGYDFPAPERFIDAGRREAAIADCQAHADRFRVAWMGWGLFELRWRMRGFENALMDATVEEDFYEELLDRLTLAGRGRSGAYSSRVAQSAVNAGLKRPSPGCRTCATGC